MRKITTLDQLLVWLLTAMRTADHSTIASKESTTAFEMIVQTILEGCERPVGAGKKHKDRSEMRRAQAKFVREAMKLVAPTPGEFARTVQLV